MPLFGFDINIYEFVRRYVFDINTRVKSILRMNLVKWAEARAMAICCHWCFDGDLIFYWCCCCCRLCRRKGPGRCHLMRENVEKTWKYLFLQLQNTSGIIWLNGNRSSRPLLSRGPKTTSQLVGVVGEIILFYCIEQFDECTPDILNHLDTGKELKHMVHFEFPIISDTSRMQTMDLNNLRPNNTWTSEFY